MFDGGDKFIFGGLVWKRRNSVIVVNGFFLLAFVGELNLSQICI